ncbi:YciI family protein [Thalassotalea marina]|uniref:YCII-related domain-containing protein n=1 Tax=Thalassotalea marina TaxID=1673741 RepID=A0A919EMI5_9GAMM|nr:YciI family protein [Thalassotalea marina]GHG00251.1 hypothetical protein GCM10017161_31120 [Thalassotalea marina]
MTLVSNEGIKMFVISLTYLVEREQVLPFLEEHYQYLDNHYEQGVFIASGPNESKNGGVIIAHKVTREQVEDIIQQDPFIKNNLASIEIIAFEPTKGKYAK